MGFKIIINHNEKNLVVRTAAAASLLTNNLDQKKHDLFGVYALCTTQHTSMELLVVPARIVSKLAINCTN